MVDVRMGVSMLACFLGSATIGTGIPSAAAPVERGRIGFGGTLIPCASPPLAAFAFEDLNLRRKPLSTDHAARSYHPASLVGSEVLDR